MSISIQKFGSTRQGGKVQAFVLTGNGGASCTLLDYGGTIQSLRIPDHDGHLADVVLGYDDMAGYESPFNAFQGALIGRHGNRIEDAVFEINGKTYPVAANDGRNHLHGGRIGFDKKIWQAEPMETTEGPAVRFSLFSPDGEEGYPGNLTVKVTYTLTHGNALRLDYDAVSDQDTVINLTNHTYFNLNGHQSGPILNHLVKIEADQTTVINAECIPNGQLVDVADTALDFRQPHVIGDRIAAAEQPIQAGGGYDHNFVLREKQSGLKACATVCDPISGRCMVVTTTLPGVQFYTANFLKKHTGKGGATYDKRSGLCLETQFFPNSLKHKNFPSPVFAAGVPFQHTTIYQFQ